jgi:putative oxidoreductase
LLLRLVAGIALIGQAVTILRTDPEIEPVILHIVSAVAGLLLLAGLWTPLAGALVAVFELWNTLWQPGDPWAKIPLGTLGVAFVLLGPGVWSVDARLFGWKRIDIRASKS